jgi:hypothetical protein
MDRRSFLAFSVSALGGCGRSTPLAPPALPVLVAGWRRGEWEHSPPEEAPPPVAALKVRGGFRTRFTAEAREIRLRAWAMGSDASAFEVQQKWPHAPGVVTFYHGWWFFSLEGSGVTVEELVRFAGDVEKALPAGR